VRVVVRSRLGWFYGHWDADVKRSRRCADRECALCARGLEKRTFGYCWVELPNGETQVLELSGRQGELAYSLQQRGTGSVGTVLIIQKTGPARNSPIQIIEGDTVSCEELDIWGFVNTLGLPAKVARVESRLTG
jgi:hypothetical protein